MKNIILILSAVLIAASCRKKPDPIDTYVPPTDSTITQPGGGSMAFRIRNVAGSAAFSLNEWYKNENGDSLRVFEYKYYISNISLYTEEDSVYYEPESYRLIDQGRPESGVFDVGNIPPGRYTKMQFLIGVDSRRNTEGAQTGALDPIHGMFWDWNTGYIMAKLEGESPQTLSSSKQVVYHIGGFKGPYSVLRYVTIPFSESVVVSSEKKPTIHLDADILEWFKTPHLIKLGETSGSMTPGEELSAIADNYADMFHLNNIQQ